MEDRTSNFQRELGGLGGEAEEGGGEAFGAAAEGFADGVLHGAVEAGVDAGVGFDAVFAHLVEGPEPDVIFLFAADAIAVEADGVVANFVEEDGEADGGAGIGRLDPVDGSAVGIGDAPGAAGHAFAPASDADGVTLFHFTDDLEKVGHGYLYHRQIIGLSLSRRARRHIGRVRAGRAGVTYGNVCFDWCPRRRSYPEIGRRRIALCSLSRYAGRGVGVRDAFGG
jgi:hypothetical protein